MRARQLGIAALLVLALLGVSGCGDDAEPDDTGTEADDGDAGGDGNGGDGNGGNSDGDGDDGDGEGEGEGDAENEGGEGDGEGSDLATYADAVALAEAMGCADTFRVVDAPEVGSDMPSPTSIGFCGGLGAESMLEVYADDDVADMRRMVDLIGCQMLPEFTWVVGGNWVVTPSEANAELAADLAEALGGEPSSCA